jgi:hypothetical protein
MNRRVVVNEIILTVRRPRGERRAPVTVDVTNAAACDRRFLAAIAGVVQVWFRAMGRRTA